MLAKNNGYFDKILIVLFKIAVNKLFNQIIETTIGMIVFFSIDVNPIILFYLFVSLLMDKVIISFIFLLGTKDCTS